MAATSCTPLPVLPHLRAAHAAACDAPVDVLPAASLCGDVVVGTFTSEQLRERLGHRYRSLLTVEPAAPGWDGPTQAWVVRCFAEQDDQAVVTAQLHVSTLSQTDCERTGWDFGAAAEAHGPLMVQVLADTPGTVGIAVVETAQVAGPQFAPDLLAALHVATLLVPEVAVGEAEWVDVVMHDTVPGLVEVDLLGGDPDLVAGTHLTVRAADVRNLAACLDALGDATMATRVTGLYRQLLAAAPDATVGLRAA